MKIRNLSHSFFTIKYLNKFSNTEIILDYIFLRHIVKLSNWTHVEMFIKIFYCYVKLRVQVLG